MRPILPLLLAIITAFKVLPYTKQPYLNTNLLMSYKSTMQTVSTYQDIDLQETHNKSRIFHVESTHSFIFNEQLLSAIYPFQPRPRRPQYIEVSYAHATSRNRHRAWVKFGRCIPNHSHSRATYRQGWSVDVGSGVTFRLDFSSFLGGVGPAFKRENNMDFGVGGVIACEVEPGNTVQFAILVDSFDVENVRFREVKFLKKGLKKVYEKGKGWMTFPRYRLVNKNNIQLACFTDPNVLNC
ncbi:hypothetical protein Cantr_09841 [Candida viswanathii]|uniref:SPRY domain-containing protein n=1 Tax=Candida viswanathii TaxID=5486 RepID=A0A367YB41_9ASCO|nr:hypothetical protein Cantr_09841 [Candida viswanathii]